MKQKNRLFIIIIIFLFFVVLIGFAYGYFLTRIKGNENNKSISVTTANLELIYEDGNGVLTPSKLLQPGDSIKFLDINGNKQVNEYIVVLENIVNNIYNRDDFTYTLKCVSVDKNTNIEKGTCNGITDIPFPRNDEIMVTNSIDVNIKHKYTLTLMYKETNKNQSIDMGKTISAKINIYDRRDKYPLLIENNIVYNNNYIVKLTKNIN